MRRRATALALSGALVLGGLGTGLVAVPVIAAASTTDSTTDATDATDATDDATDAATDLATRLADRVSRVRDALQSLVDDGTLDGDQADAVATTLAEQGPAGPGRPGGDGGPGGPGGHGPGGGPGADLAAAATALGLDETDLRTQLQGGATLGDVAQAQGVSTDDLTAALLAAAQTHLDDEVSEGDLTRAEADERLARLQDGVADLLSRDLSDLGGRGGPGGHHGRPGGPTDATDDAAESPTGGAADGATTSSSADV